MLFVIQGPTASGKTHAAIDLALFLGTEIVSADSRQFYKEMAIGTARPTEIELDLVKHHFIGNKSFAEPMNVAEYQVQAERLCQRLLDQFGAVVITGGSSQFVDALLYGLDEIPTFKAISNSLVSDLHQHGISCLGERLKLIDPKAYNTIDVNNPRRVIRALEVYLGTGRSITEFQLNNAQPKFEYMRFFINWERKLLYDRINQRVDSMIKDGLEEEVKSLFHYKDSLALNTVGYKEWWDYFEQKVSYDFVIEKIKQNSRNYAKRQITWSKKYTDKIDLFGDDETPLLQQMLIHIDKSNVVK